MNSFAFLEWFENQLMLLWRSMFHQ
jgi:hypothetical protein